MFFSLSLIFIIFTLCVYFYAKVLYESVRKAKIITKKLKKINHKNNVINKNNNLINNQNIVQDEEIIVTELKQAPGPLPLPILGNLNLIGEFEVPFEGFTELAKRYGDVYSLTLGSQRTLIVNSLDSIKEVLNHNGKFFGGRPDFIRYHILFGGDRANSLALCDWSQLQQKRRNLARKHCSPRETSSYFTKMSNIGCFEMEQFMKKLSVYAESGSECHIKPLIMQTCANMFTQYMCSVRFDYEDKEFQTICRYFDEIFWEINQGYAVDFLPWLLPFYRNHMKKIVNWSTSIRNFILDRIIMDRESKLDIDEPEKDFTDALLKSLAQDGDVSRDTIIFMLEDFIGGHSAIGNLVMMALASIVRNPEIGRKIQQEIDEVTGGERNVTLMDGESMPYTVATIFEVLRDSSSPIVPHVATEDVAVSGYGVTKGTIVFINNYELNKSEKYWDRPTVFDPERFIENIEILDSDRELSDASNEDSGVENDIDDIACEKLKSNSTHKAKQIRRIKKNIPHFLPFSIGKRTCIGQNLVKGFGFIMLANIMQSYSVSCSDLNSIKTYPACVALPPDTFSLKLTSRKF